MNRQAITLVGTIDRSQRVPRHGVGYANKMDTLPCEMDRVAEHARTYMAATAGVTGEKVDEARHRLNSALERLNALCGRLREEAVGAARMVDKAVREKPYHAICIALGAGLVMGLQLGRRFALKHKHVGLGK